MSKYTVQTIPDKKLLYRLKEIAARYDSTPDDFLDACENSVVGEQISIQINYERTGELPE